MQQKNIKLIIQRKKKLTLTTTKKKLSFFNKILRNRYSKLFTKFLMDT